MVSSSPLLPFASDTQAEYMSLETNSILNNLEMVSGTESSKRASLNAEKDETRWEARP